MEVICCDPKENALIFRSPNKGDKVDVEELSRFSSTASRVLPVRKIEDRMLESTPVPLTRKHMALMGEIEAGWDERFKDWLFPVD